MKPVIPRERRESLQRLAMGRFATAVASYANSGTKWTEERTWTDLLDADFTETRTARAVAKRPSRGVPYVVTNGGGSFRFCELTVADTKKAYKWQPFALDCKMIMSNILQKLSTQQSIYFADIELNFCGIFNQKIVDEIYENANKSRNSEGNFPLFIPESALINPEADSLLPAGRVL